MGFPGGASGKEHTCQCRRHKRHGFSRLVEKIPWRRAWQPTPIFLPGESHWQKNLVGYSPRGCKELDTTERLTHSIVHSLYPWISHSQFQPMSCHSVELVNAGPSVLRGDCIHCTAPLYLQDLSFTNFGICQGSQNQSPQPFPLYTEREACANFHCVEEAYRSVNCSRLQIP